MQHNCSCKYHAQEGAHQLIVMCSSIWNRLTFSLLHLPKASGVTVNKEAFEVNNCSWENVLAGLPLCCWGHSVVSVSWASALTAARMLQTFTVKFHWVISKLHCTSLSTGLAELCDIGLPMLKVRNTRVGYRPGRRGPTHAEEFKYTVCICWMATQSHSTWWI